MTSRRCLDTLLVVFASLVAVSLAHAQGAVRAVGWVQDASKATSQSARWRVRPSARHLF